MHLQHGMKLLILLLITTTKIMYSEQSNVDDLLKTEETFILSASF